MIGNPGRLGNRGPGNRCPNLDIELDYKKILEILALRKRTTNVAYKPTG